MKFRFLSFLVFSLLLVKAQSDTILYNGFSFLAVDSTSSTFDLSKTNEVNIQFQRWEIRSDMRALSNSISENMDTYIWFDDQIWRTWHIIPYIESIDTTINDDIISYDTTNNIGIRSFSWFENPNRASSVLMTPPIYLNDNSGVLYWKSKPQQGPRYQDGYKVYVLEGSLNNPDNVPFQSLDYNFAMKELDVTNSSPLKTITSLKELKRDFGFVPEDGFNHTEYTLPNPNPLGDIDSTRQHPFMQKFNLSLEQYTGFIRIAFVHDSYDNNSIILDDLLITGNGVIGSKEIYSDDLKMFPNPTVDHLFIQFSDSWIKPEIKIFDINGRLVMNQILHNLEPIKVGTLEPGQYFVQLKTENKIFVQSFVKLK